MSIAPQINRHRTVAAFALAAATLLAGMPAMAAEHVIQMKNRGANNRSMVFEPEYVKAAVGDTIRIVVADKLHNAETIPGVWPDGVAPIKGKVNEEITLTITAEGLYGIKCTPHYAMGMVGLIVVGKAPVTEAHRAVRQPGQAQRIFTELLDRAAKEPGV